MTDPADSICKINLVVNNLNRAICSCKQEDHSKITALCDQAIEQLGNIKSWANDEDRPETA